MDVTNTSTHTHTHKQLCTDTQHSLSLAVRCGDGGWLTDAAASLKDGVGPVMFLLREAQGLMKVNAALSHRETDSFSFSLFLFSYCNPYLPGWMTRSSPL